MVPVVGLMVSPVGRLMAVQVRGSRSGSVPVMGTVRGLPVRVVWVPGLTMMGGRLVLRMVQVKVLRVVALPSVAVMVTG